MRARWHWLIPIVVCGALLAPIALTNRTFATDWGNHLWLIWAQGLNIRDLGAPSYFLQSNLGAFYPYFAFYGGSIYAALGIVAWWLSPEIAVFVGYAGALAAAYLGWTWIARQAGLVGWQQQLPGCIAVTAPYAVTNLYGRGDIPEAIATSVLPLLAASALSLVREPRVRLGPAVLYVVSVAVLTGTHTLTLVWGSSFLLLCALVVIACNWRGAWERRRRGLTLAGLGILGVGINSWVLMPLVLFHNRLLEGEPDPITFTGYTAPEHLFSLIRNTGQLYSGVTADVNAQLPVLALLWALAFGMICWRLLTPTSRRLALGALGVLCVFLLLILSPSLIGVLPRDLRYIQFPYRLVTFADFAIVGLVTLTLVGLRRAGPAARIPVLQLALVAAIGFGLSVNQCIDVRSWLSGREAALRSSVRAPTSWYAPAQFSDGSAPVVEPTLKKPLELPVEEGRRESYATTYPPGPAGTVVTNVKTGPYLVDVSGARPVGRTESGEMIVRLPASPDRPRRVVVAAAWEPAVTVGRWMTVAFLLAAFVALAVALATRRRRRG